MRGRDLARRAYADGDSAWVRSFDPLSIKCLVVCRGPVRLEAFEIFDAIGIREYGMLLSEKDSVTYPRCLAPELRGFRFPHNVHRVPDYMGVGQAEKQQRIREIVEIAVAHGYTHIFAGDEDLFPSGYSGPKAYFAVRLGVSFWFSLSERIDTGLPD